MPDALETARALDEEFARTGRLKGPLHGVVFAIKDQFDTFDMRSTSGAAADYANDRPPRDAAVVARLRAAGAIILAKANMGEYAAGDRSTFGGTTCNPYDTTRSAGRSSGGSGAAVAANLVTCAIGEETGPSARNPAANGSLVGIVATHSLVSRAGLIPASLTRDRPGLLCRTVKDAATVLAAVAGYDPRDPATAASEGQVRPYADNADACESRRRAARRRARVHAGAHQGGRGRRRRGRERLARRCQGRRDRGRSRSGRRAVHRCARRNPPKPRCRNARDGVRRRLSAGQRSRRDEHRDRRPCREAAVRAFAPRHSRT